MMDSTNPDVRDLSDIVWCAASPSSCATDAASYPIVRIASIHRVDDALPVLGLLRATDWKSYALSLTDPWHQEAAAQAIAHGAIACHPFGNVFMLTCRPDEPLVDYLTAVKGLSADQPRSVVTTPARLQSLFDWSALPSGLEREQVLGLAEVLQRLGPIGFRGPAARHLPPHLTASEFGLRTVQAISPGYACASNELFERLFVRIPEDYVYGTWANRASPSDGSDAGPVHYRLAPLQAEFGQEQAFLMLGAGESSDAYADYPLHAPTSASVLSFHKLLPSERGRPRLALERHGSMSLDDLRPIAQRFGLEVGLAPGATARFAERQYPMTVVASGTAQTMHSRNGHARCAHWFSDAK